MDVFSKIVVMINVCVVFVFISLLFVRFGWF